MILKKLSSHRLYKTSTSRIIKSPKLASESYNKGKNRKFTYQKPLADDSKLKDFFQGSSSDKKSIPKKSKNKLQVKAKLNFKRKQVYLLTLSILVYLFAILVKYQLAMHFCIVIYPFKSIIYHVLILCLIFPTNFLTKHMFSQTASPIIIRHFTIFYQERARTL